MNKQTKPKTIKGHFGTVIPNDGTAIPQNQTNMNKTNMKIKWINAGIAEEGDIGCWISSDQRFDIEPIFNHGTRPWSYKLHDRKLKTKHSEYGVRKAKQTAQAIVDKEAIAAVTEPEQAWVWTGRGVEYKGQVISTQAIIRHLNAAKIIA